MALGTAAEEVAWSDEIWKSSNVEALREQQETDFGLWGPYKFAMPEEEGKWDNVTSPSQKIIANKLIGLLSSSWARLYIDTPDEGKRERKRVSNTEQLANGIIWLADREAIKVPSGKRLQAALASDAVIRGGTAKSLLWYKGDDGKPHCDVKRYDPMFCQWEEEDGGIAKFCHRNYVTRRYIQRHYRKQAENGLQAGSADPQGRYCLYTFWDEDEWKVAINGEWVDGEWHNLGYVPVNVRSCGAAPYYQSELYQDTMKWSWMSYAYNNRDMADIESRLMSIIFSKAKEAGKIKGIAKFDGSLSDGKVPEEIKKLGYSDGGRNEMVFLDTSKGQDFVMTVEPPSNQQVLEAYNLFRQLSILSQIDPIAFGQMTGSGSGVLAEQLRASALEFITPFRECVEQDLTWFGEEGVRQFKNGKFKKLSLEGRNSKKQKFYIDLSHSDVEEQHFECELVSDRLRDEIQQLGAYINAVSSRALSRQTALNKFQVVDDPDLEMDILDREKHKEMADNDMVQHYAGLAKYFADQGTKEGDELALMYQSLLAMAIKALVQQAAGLMAPPPAPEGGGAPPETLSPQAQAGRTAAEPLTSMRQMGY